jgi:CRP/FNR family transcriptional regulator
MMPVTMAVDQVAAVALPRRTAHDGPAAVASIPPVAVASIPPFAPLGSSCDVCRFRTSCLGRAFRTARSRPVLVGYRRHLAAGEALYHEGSKCSLVHVVQAGFFKTTVLSEDGIARITGFPMPGDVLGADGLSSGIHRCDAIALTQASVCVVSRARLLQACAENEELCRNLLGVMSDEIRAGHAAMLLLGNRSAEERVSGFIVALSERLAARGYSGSEIGLWMSREDMARFLGLELETVSRALSSLARRRLIYVHRRHLRIPDRAALRALAAGSERSGSRRGRRRASPAGSGVGR